jgi:DNA polymerase I-like protein with 3'-5' exonuclease and polymerase domains
MDRRMRTAYNLGGTTTGRTSTAQTYGEFLAIKKNKIVKCQYGTAFQKITKREFKFLDQSYGKDLREIYVPSPGYEFFAFDGKNAEGRVVCLLAEDWETLEYIESGNDIHALTASWIFQKPPEICKKDKEMRNIGKMARHAGNLGQSGAGLSTQVYKSIKYCNEVMDKFHKNAPKVKGVFQFQIQKAIEQYRILRNPFGRFRQFFKMDEKNRYDIYKEAYSYIPQGTVSDHFKMISLKIAERCPNVFQLVEAHDGLLYEIPKGFRDQFADIVLEETSGEIDFTQCTLPRTRKLKIPVEMEFSETNWASMAEYSRETAEVSK